MGIRQKQVIMVDVTPGGLREIADRLEKQWKRAVAGDDVPRHIFPERDGIEVQLVIDQDEQHRLDWIEKKKQSNY